MNHMTAKSLSTLSTLAVLTASLTSSAIAQQYGTTAAAVPQDLTIDKQVRHPISGKYVENLLDGTAYSPGTDVVYKLRITNSSNQTFSTVQVTDNVDNRAGKNKLVNPKVDEPDKNKVTDVKNPDNKTLVFVLKDSLKPGETREIGVKAQVVSASNFKKDETRVCDVQNLVKVTADTRSDDDTATICIQSEVVGAKKLPESGVTDFLPLVPFVGTGITGLTLLFKRKKTS